MGLRRRQEDDAQPKLLEVDASMTGSLVFRDPVNLQINGQFEGSLDAKGSLSIGPAAHVRVTLLQGEQITIAGTVEGPVTASKRLELLSTAKVTGNITTPKLVIQEGAVLQGACEMVKKPAPVSDRTWMTLDELARYLEIDVPTVQEWAKAGRLPGSQEGAEWRFDRNRIEVWIAQEKIK